MEKIEFKNKYVGAIVTDDFRTSTIFKNAGIDFCCGGRQTVSEACADHQINIAELEKQISELQKSPVSPSLDFKEWELPFLMDYIVNTHHKYVIKTLPDLVFYTRKIAEVHGDHHPELIDIAQKITEVATELEQHLKNEEEVLFPAIRSFLISKNEKDAKTIESEITRMFGEHDFAGGTLDEINHITEGYKLPDDACNTWHVAFKTLEQFEDDIHVHVHLENNILFPRALELSKK
ncbi:iron-sulfur cluster repair di-iron protein [Prolixibacteraceae bacterium Z1-6]|uniref:Iron-sulfur cluster repair di-iron protein n=1 Tax=Draconibacterium aestuarii TaxID=2998507 RepID=A0A9X3J6Q4_9BACT|nr:iron-sulfur cluster repair di-iron protein [Prolixibacteraceae bacterium Z1-6]